MGAGVYFYRLSGAGVLLIRSMLLIDGQVGKPGGRFPHTSKACLGIGKEI